MVDVDLSLLKDLHHHGREASADLKDRREDIYTLELKTPVGEGRTT